MWILEAASSSKPVVAIVFLLLSRSSTFVIFIQEFLRDTACYYHRLSLLTEDNGKISLRNELGP